MLEAAHIPHVFDQARLDAYFYGVVVLAEDARPLQAFQLHGDGVGRLDAADEGRRENGQRSVDRQLAVEPLA